MNPAALMRLMQLLGPPRGSGVDPGIFDGSADPRGMLPSPESLGRTPIDVRSPESMGPLAPQPLSDEERIRKLFTEETPGMKNYRDYVANAPTHEQYKPSKGRVLLSALLGAGATFLDDKNPNAIREGMQLGTGVANARYDRAVEDYKTKGKGLGEVAALDERRKGREIQAETTIEGIKSRRESAREANQARMDSLEIRRDELEEKMRKAGQDDTTKNKIAADHDAVMLEIARLRREAAGSDKLREVADPTNPERTTFKTEAEIIADKKAGKNTPGKLTTTERNRVSQAKTILTDADRIIQMVDDAEHAGDIGPARGRIQKVRGTIGMQTESVRKLQAQLKSFASLLPILHGYRGGVQTQKNFEDMIGGLEQNSAPLKGAIAAVKNLANDIIAGRAVVDEGGGGKGKTMTLKDGTVIEVEP